MKLRLSKWSLNGFKTDMKEVWNGYRTLWSHMLAISGERTANSIVSGGATVAFAEFSNCCTSCTEQLNAVLSLLINNKAMDADYMYMYI